MIHHVTVGVSDLDRSRSFYRRALAPLGFDHTATDESTPDEIEFGTRSGHAFAISTAYLTGAPVHVAFRAASREHVDAFHAAALAGGGRDNGPPGLRPQYSADYYGAFVLDPDGHNIEAVFRPGD